MLSPFGAYPNPLGITKADRESFSPVVKHPMQCWNGTVFVCPCSDHATGAAAAERRQLATPQEHRPPAPARRKLRRIWHALASRATRWWRTQFPVAAATLSFALRQHPHRIGRYDEDRVGLYTSELFNNNRDDDCTKRTIHIGLDLSAPVNTPVYALTDGVIHSAGYNPALGDYGNVIVVEHFIRNNTVSFFALYGHLANASLSVGGRKRAGDAVRRGQVLGWMGDVHEGGGWLVSHVHFQVAQHAPDDSTPHDMPGAVCRRDRAAALVEYFDPRYVLGELY